MTAKQRGESHPCDNLDFHEFKLLHATD